MDNFKEIISMLSFVAYCGFLITAMIGDVRKFRISNKLNIFFFLSFIFFAILMGLGWQQILSNLAVSIIAFIICFALFSLGLFGGGDVKLVWATCFWLGSAPMYTYSMATALCGGILALFLLISRQIVKRYGLPRGPKWLRGMLRNRAHIPYGVALGFGGMIAVHQAIWMN